MRACRQRCPGALRGACLAAVLPWLVLTVVVYGIILVGGFVVSVGRDNTPTLEYFWTAFSFEQGVARVVPVGFRAGRPSSPRSNWR